MRDKRPPLPSITYVIEVSAKHTVDEKVIRWAHATALREATGACRRNKDITVLAADVRLDQTVVGDDNGLVTFVFVAQPTWRSNKRLR